MLPVALVDQAFRSGCHGPCAWAADCTVHTPETSALVQPNEPLLEKDAMVNGAAGQDRPRRSASPSTPQNDTPQAVSRKHPGERKPSRGRFVRVTLTTGPDAGASVTLITVTNRTDGYGVQQDGTARMRLPELTQIKCYPGRVLGGEEKISLPHGKMLPEIGGNEVEKHKSR